MMAFSMVSLIGMGLIVLIAVGVGLFLTRK